MSARKPCAECAAKQQTIDRLLGIVDALTAKKPVPTTTVRTAGPDPDLVAVRRAEQERITAELDALQQSLGATFGLKPDQAATALAELRAAALNTHLDPPT